MRRVGVAAILPRWLIHGEQAYGRIMWMQAKAKSARLATRSTTSMNGGIGHVLYMVASHGQRARSAGAASHCRTRLSMVQICASGSRLGAASRADLTCAGRGTSPQRRRTGQPRVRRHIHLTKIQAWALLRCSYNPCRAPGLPALPVHRLRGPLPRRARVDGTQRPSGGCRCESFLT
jgi:hypothetical protein